jgi:hypothetical protein
MAVAVRVTSLLVANPFVEYWITKVSAAHARST